LSRVERRLRLVLREHFGRHIHGWRFDEAIDSRLVRKKRGDFLSKIFVARARIAEKCLSFARRPLLNQLVQPLDFPPAFRIYSHGHESSVSTDERDKPIHRRCIAATPGFKQLSDFPGLLPHQGTPSWSTACPNSDEIIYRFHPAAQSGENTRVQSSVTPMQAVIENCDSNSHHFC
jgi:hypothetical protein